MATRADLELARRALNRVSAGAGADLRAVLASVDPEDRVAVRAALTAAYPLVMAEYGGASAALGADMSEMWVSDLGVRPQLAVAPAPTQAQAVGAAAWALTKPDWQGNLMVLTDQMVKQPYRDTLQGTAHRSGVAWARVPMGAETCAFCIMAASRGAVYVSSATAGADRKWHGDCDCQVTMVRSPEDYPEGYDPDRYYDIYAQGWEHARDNAEKVTTSSVLAGMRQVADLH